MLGTCGMFDVEVAIGGGRISDDDVDNLLAKGWSSIEREGRQLLHALPAFYTIDEVNGVKQPRGLHAEKLGVNIHVITADPAPWKNLNLCVRSAHLGVEATVGVGPVPGAAGCGAWVGAGVR